MKTCLKIVTVECAGLSATCYTADTKENLEKAVAEFKAWNEPNSWLGIYRVRKGFRKCTVIETLVIMENE